MPTKPPTPCTRCGRPATNRGLCQQHLNRYETQRGTTTARGYGTHHQNTRAAYQPLVDAGQATCWRCTQPIHPTDQWDLGHDDNDRTIVRGPEHANCNRAAGGHNRTRP